MGRPRRRAAMRLDHGSSAGVASTRSASKPRTRVIAAQDRRSRGRRQRGRRRRPARRRARRLHARYWRVADLRRGGPAPLLGPPRVMAATARSSRSLAAATRRARRTVSPGFERARRRPTLAPRRPDADFGCADAVSRGARVRRPRARLLGEDARGSAQRGFRRERSSAAAADVLDQLRARRLTRRLRRSPRRDRDRAARASSRAAPSRLGDPEGAGGVDPRARSRSAPGVCSLSTVAAAAAAPAPPPAAISHLRPAVRGRAQGPARLSDDRRATVADLRRRPGRHWWELRPPRVRRDGVPPVRGRCPTPVPMAAPGRWVAEARRSRVAGARRSGRAIRRVLGLLRVVRGAPSRSGVGLAWRGADGVPSRRQPRTSSPRCVAWCRVPAQPLVVRTRSSMAAVKRRASRERLEASRGREGGVGVGQARSGRRHVGVGDRVAGATPSSMPRSKRPRRRRSARARGGRTARDRRGAVARARLDEDADTSRSRSRAATGRAAWLAGHRPDPARSFRPASRRAAAGRTDHRE